MSDRRWLLAAVFASAFLAACGNDAAVEDPGPTGMCPPGEYPVLSAYRAEDGGYLWAICDERQDYNTVLAAEGADVWVERFGLFGTDVLRIDGRAGEVVEEGAVRPSTDGASAFPRAGSIEVAFGPNDVLEGRDIATGEVVWRAIDAPALLGFTADDDSLYLRISDESRDVVSLDIRTGAERWRIDGRQLPGTPRSAADGLVYMVGSDLAALDAADGSLQWRTSYSTPEGEYPMMVSVASTEAIVYASWTQHPPGD